MKTILYPLCFTILLSCTDTKQKDTASAPAATDTNQTAKTQTKNEAQNTSALRYGKYGCTASKYNNGVSEYVPKGYFTIANNGAYTYYGFEKQSSGTFTVDKDGNLHFKGGYFDGGKAEKIDRPNKFFLVFPSIPDNRWTCGWVEENK